MFEESKSGKWAEGFVVSLIVGVLLSGVMYTLNRERGDSSSTTSTNQIVVPSSSDYVSPLSRMIAESGLPLDPTWFGVDTPSIKKEDVTLINKKSASSTYTFIKDSEGKTYSDPKVLGVIDSAHVAIVASGDAGRAILSVAQDGQATPLATLSTSTVPFLNNQGSVCLK